MEPVKTKSGQDVTAAFEKILKRSQGRTPQKLQKDDGKEFYNKHFQAFMKQKNIHHFSTSGGTKASIVERFNRTLKERLYRYFTIKNTLTFLPVLQDLVLGYNRSYHSSIKMAPNKVTASNQEEVWNNLYAKRLNAKRLKPKFKVNDRVRLYKKHRVFKKGYLPGWTEEVFIVSRVVPGSVVTYKIKETADTPLEGRFYSQDLQKVTVSDDDLYQVEKVLKRKGNKLLVRWKGWPDKYDTLDRQEGREKALRMSQEFYITLLSHSNRAEFPQNQSNYLEIRLPHPIRLQGSSWKVGLSSISLPDVKVHLPKLVDGNEILFTMDWIMTYPSGALKFGRAHYDPNDLRAVVEYIDGVGFVKSMVTFFEQRRILNYGGPHLGSSYTASDGKRTYVKFRWGGDDLLTDNKATQVHSNYSPALKINKMLALKMEWLKERSPGNYDLGPNLRQDFFTDTVPNLETMTHDLKNDRDEPLFWLIGENLFHLSVTCDWRFTNLNKAFQNVVGSTLRSLFIYSDVGGSSVVGNQVTDLLREVNYRRTGDGSHYFEPLHIQYIPLRKDVVDIIETQVSETTGELTEFGEGNTILTLHFK